MKFIPYTIGPDKHVTEPTVPSLLFYKSSPHAFAPHWGTEHSACFDLKACLTAETVKIFLPSNETRFVTCENNKIMIQPGERAMVPTGLIFDIPFGYSVRIHSRSGLALKQGLVMANHEGIVDSDYVDPCFLLVHNTASVVQLISHGDRLAQGEMIPDPQYEVLETPSRPQQKTDRSGGFGHTGA